MDSKFRRTTRNKVQSEKINDESKFNEGSDSSDSSEDEDCVNIDKKIKSLRSNLRNDRLPTRRPDPNVYNRNALLARENRRRKKEYTEMLERGIEKQRKINKKLQKMLKRQAEYVKTLQSEKNYFKSILANKKQIVSLVNLVKSVTSGIAAQQPPSSLPVLTERKNVTASSEFSLSPSSLSSNSSPPQDLQTTDMIAHYDDDYSFPLNDYSSSWDNLLCDDEQHSSNLFATVLTEKQNNYHCNNLISNEHSYFNTSIADDAKQQLCDDSGVCLHISGGKLSLEFCASCHENSKQSVIKENY